MSLPVRFVARQAGRELRGLLAKGGLFVACLATGVAAAVSVAGLADAVEQGLRVKARELLAADVVVSSRQPIPADVAEAARALPGARTAEIVEAYSMVAADQIESGQAAARSVLCEVKAVGAGWPFHGRVVLEPDAPLERLLTDDTALIAPTLARRLQVGIGDVVRLGEARFTVAGLVVQEPDQAVGRIALAPRLLLTRAGIERAALLGPGSRQMRKLLVALPVGGAPEPAVEAIQAAIGSSPFVEVESFRDAQPDLRRQIDRSESFLGLVALLSLVIGGAGIAQAARAWLRSRVDAIALLRCLGLRPRDVLVLYLALVAALGIAGSLLGAGAGILALRAAPAVLGDMLEGITLASWQPAAMLHGVALGLVTALAFSLPTLSELLRVPALRALRSSAEPPPPRRAGRVVLACALLGFGLVTASVQAGSFARGAMFTGALVGTGLALAAAARLASRGLAALAPASGRAWLRLALGAARRPGSGVLSATVALGLGVLVVLSVVLVQSGLRQELMARLPTAAPSTFLLDIRPGQWPDVEALLRREGATNVLSTPMLTARLRSIDDVPTARLAEAEGREGREGRGEWALTREQRLTWRTDLPEDNTLVAGALWSDPGRAEVSIEEEFAADLGLTLGSRIGIDVQGVPIELVVTSLRRVEWRTFRINFFLIVEPGVLDDAPHSILAAARLPEGREAPVQDALVALAPNVTAVPIRDALQRVAQLVTRLAKGVRAVGAFTVIAGLAILAGAVAAGASRRGGELALLKTLGMTQREAAAMLVVEHASLGLVAGLVGAAGGSVLSWVVLSRVMELPWHLRPGTLALAVAGAALLAALSGTLVSLGALRRRPIEVLRREE